MSSPYQSFSGDATNGADYTVPANYQPPTNADLESGTSAAVPDAVSKYETALPLRVDVASAMAYALGSISGIIFLMFEWKNDYVRFNAWQSCLVFTPLLVLKFIFVFISMGFFWFLLVVSALLAAWCGYMAFTGADQLRRYQLPVIGHMAARWTDTE